jgi:flavin reductase (DIM6/NTAB) family NADH-FMN oxidoreductase RutF
LYAHTTVLHAAAKTFSEERRRKMKKKLDGINVLYPTPTVLVGAMVDGKPNFITIAHIGIVNHARPYLISLSMAKVHYTNPGIRKNKAFSVNIPSENLVVETDYAGLVSGKKTDKSDLFDMSSVKYWSVGEAIAGCWNVGKQLKQEKKV